MLSASVKVTPLTAVHRYSSGEPGRPPCERCIREQHECVLGGSRRGGRRVKRTQSDGPRATSASKGQTSSIDSVIRPVPIPPSRSLYQSPSRSEQRLPAWTGIDRESRILPPLPQEPPAHSSTPTAKFSVDDSVASTDLQNPADALEFLAHVAERDSSTNQLPPMHGYGRPHRLSMTTGAINGTPRSNDQGSFNGPINYPPLATGQLSFEMVQMLLAR